MAGCRPLSAEEQTKVISQLGSLRDKALVTLGLRSGFRVSELLSLRLNDVWQNGCVLDRVKVRRSNMKGKVISRDVALHPEAKDAITNLVMTLRNEPESFLFQSRNHGRALSRFQAAKLMKDAFAAAGLTGSGLATHTLRKSFSQAVYKRSGNDLLVTMKALGHASVLNTIRYLQTDSAAVDAAVLAR